MTITEPAWAKLNLTLDILGKRPDGYHDLRMVMQSIDLCDMVSITFKERRGITLVTNLNYLPRDNSNIAVKAAELFFQETGIPPVGLTIRVDKHIPVAAGMAGGSSDGAAVLRLLRRALAPELPDRALEAMALQVGSDVPYCVRSFTAWSAWLSEFASTWRRISLPARFSWVSWASAAAHAAVAARANRRDNKQIVDLFIEKAPSFPGNTSVWTALFQIIQTIWTFSWVPQFRQDRHQASPGLSRICPPGRTAPPDGSKRSGGTPAAAAPRPGGPWPRR